ncbi:MAG: efflux RND transporter periplasmic adaptor subunit [Deltaproteobacteria bacterium]|nr:efflux RND transporter periplasmic adaptor subunit [Deltaproteobacteria bacterium]
MKVSRWIGLAGAVVAVGAIGVLIMQRVDKVQDKRAEVAKPVVVAPPAVKVGKVVAHEFVRTIDVQGEVRAKRVVLVFPKVAGRVEELPVGLGDAVTSETVLARIEENDLGFRERQGEAGTRAASAQVRAAQVQADNARIELERAEALYKANALPEADLIRVRGMKNAADAALSAARAQVDVARAGSDLAKEARSWTSVISPIEGVITRRLVQLGALAVQSQPIFEIQDQSTLEIQVDVPAMALDAIHIGKAVTFRVEERPGQRFDAKVKALGKSLDPATRRVRIELEVPGDVVGKGVLPAMVATVTIEIARAASTHAVPRSAVVVLAEGPSVFVVRDGKAVRLAPDLGLADMDHVAVPDARPDDQIVVEGQARLTDGGPVAILPETPSRSGGAEAPAPKKAAAP